jgi:hypothetical protein
MISKSRIHVLVVATLMISATTVIASQMPSVEQQAKAQGKQNLVQGLLTAASSATKPYGGTRIGSYALEPQGGILNVLVGMEKTPSAGKAFQAWLVNTNTSSYLNLGEVTKDGKLSFSQDNANPYRFNQILISEELPGTFVLKPSQVIGGDALPAPFGAR